MNETIACRIGLPADFRQRDILVFHGRDSQQIAERVGEHFLQKGMTWRGKPACLSFQFGSGSVEAEFSIDGAAAGDDAVQFKRMAARMLGLTQQVGVFEETYRNHPEVGVLIERNAGLRVSLTPTPFEAVAWAIVGQLISVSAAVSIRRRLIQAAGVQHSTGIWCFPDATKVVEVGEEALLGAGFSRTKANSLVTLAKLIDDGTLPVDEWIASPVVDDIREQLLAIRGIGPWTVSYVLLRGFGFLDGSLHGDVAVRRNLQTLLGRPGKIDENETKQWLRQFSPWRSLVAAHLWAMKKADGY
ncbi:MAG TPA: 3-methyladenine DNA glycosylase 2 [Burkholderiales bacterium]|nr:3-methyladenine DNA glycosylase 2 [Burkholderiales bacterium]